jgi:putative ABC transport system permease protein
MRYAFRMLRKSPGATAVAVLALSLGVGFNSAVFSVTEVLVNRPLLVSDLDRLVVIHTRPPDAGVEFDDLTPADYRDIKERAKTIAGMAAFSWWLPNISGDGNPETVRGFYATTNLFDVFREQPVLGRGFRPEESDPGRNDVVVLSGNFWERRFGSDPGVIGKTIRLDGRQFRIIGVTRKDFRFPAEAELWAPQPFEPSTWQDREHDYLSAVARLNDGYSVTDATAEMRALSENLAREYPNTNTKRFAFAAPLADWVSGELTAQYSRMLVYAVAFVLLIACANIANLQLVRFSARSREIAVRAALGASRWQLIRQLGAEGIALGLLGAAGGLVVAYWGIDVIHGAMTEEVKIHLPGWDRMGINYRVFFYTLVVALASGVLTAVLPAFSGTRFNLHSSLKEQSRGGLGSRQRVKSLLVVAQVALSIVLLAGAGLVAKGFRSIREPVPNLAPEKVLTARLTLSRKVYADPAKVRNFEEQLEGELRRIPGVESAAVAYALPYSGSRLTLPVTIEGRPAQRAADMAFSQVQWASPDYFRTMHIPRLSGRGISGADGPDNEFVAVVSKMFVDRYFPGQDPIGKHVTLEGIQGEGTKPMRIVGTVADVSHDFIDRSPRPVIYRPYLQWPSTRVDVLLRTSGNPVDLAQPLRAAVAAIDPDQPVSRVMTYRKLISDYTLGLAFVAWMMGVMGLLALLLTVIGLYSVLAYLVAERTREIGIRVALGASRSDVLRMVLARGMVITGTGLLMGLVAAATLARVLASLLFGVHAGDLAAFVSVTLVLLLAAVAACAIPARRATAVDPMVALRCE